MKAYFSAPMGIGRYPQKTRGEVFAADRRYFDQILYKNKWFRHEYAQAYAGWLQCRLDRHMPPMDILADRIVAGIEYTGQEKVRDLFVQLIHFVNSKYSGCALSPDTDYRETLPGGRMDGEGTHRNHMEYFKKLWINLALPEVREENP